LTTLPVLQASAAVLMASAFAGGCSGVADRPEADLVVRGATLIDGTGRGPRPNTDVFIADGVITAVSQGGTVGIPDRADVLDAEGGFVMPGLSDMHVHFSLGLPAPRRADETEEVLRRLLYYGVTTVLNLGASAASTDSIRAIWRRQERGDLLGPTVYGTGGHLTIAGTHPVWTIFPPMVRRAADSIVAATPEDVPADLYMLGLGVSIVRTPEAGRVAVQERAAGAMQAIKITVESSPSEFGDDHPLMPVSLIRAIVSEADTHGLPVLAHVSSPHELDSVLAGGVAGIVHAVSERPFPSQTYGAELGARRFYTVATLSLFDAYCPVRAGWDARSGLRFPGTMARGDGCRNERGRRAPSPRRPDRLRDGRRKPDGLRWVLRA